MSELEQNHIVQGGAPGNSRCQEDGNCSCRQDGNGNFRKEDLIGIPEGKSQKEKSLGGAKGKTPKSLATKRKILDVASQLIAQRGSADFQMAEVAALCNMSKGALYYYFKDRDAVIEEILTEKVDEFIDTVEERMEAAATPDEALQALCLSFAESMDSGRTIIATMATELARGGSSALDRAEQRIHHLNSLIAHQINLAKKTHAVREDADAELLSSCISGTFFFAALSPAATDAHPVPATKLADTLMDFIAHGIALH